MKYTKETLISVWDVHFDEGRFSLLKNFGEVDYCINIDDDFAYITFDDEKDLDNQNVLKFDSHPRELLEKVLMNNGYKSRLL